ncbi:MAG: YcxB family protein [Anaerolineae bacterium]|jgi:hypothetical protein
MRIELAGRYTKQDIDRALALDRGRVKRIMGMAYGFVALLMALAAVAGALAAPGDVAANLGAAVPRLALALLLGAALLLWPRIQSRVVANSALYRGPVTGAVSDVEVSLASAEAESRVLWEEVEAYAKADDIVLLYAGGEAVKTLPRHFFASDEEWQRFQRRVEAALPMRRAEPRSLIRWVIFGVVLVVLAACSAASIVLQIWPALVP